MLIDSEKVKDEIDYRMGFLNGIGCSESFKNGYEMALKQLKDWLRYEEELFEVFKNAGLR